MRNARTHSRRQIRQIADSIRTFGFTNPVLVNGSRMIIVVASEISPSDMIYRPQSALCLETFGGLPTRSRDLRELLSQIHPYLTKAMKNILAQEGCGTLQEAVESFPVLRGLKENELKLFRGNSNVTAITASKELLNVRLSTVLKEASVDRYFRPTPYSPR